MSKVLAILMEPAQYTLDRNRIVYDPYRIDYVYLHPESAASEVQAAALFSSTSLLHRIRVLQKILHQYDIVIINGYNTVEFILLWMLNLFYRRIIGIESDTPLRIPKSFLKRFVKWIYLHIIFAPPRIYGLAGGTKSHMQLFTHYGMSEQRVFLMPLVIDSSKFSNPHHASSDNDNVFRFLYVGRLVSCKGLETLLEVFSRLHRSLLLKTELILVGGGEQEADLKAVWQNVHGISFVGKKYGNDLIEVYRQGDCLVLPSKAETWGLVVNEAMAAGLPVIVSDSVGAQWDLLENKETGIIFPTGDADALYEAMKTLAENKMLCRRYGKNAWHLLNKYWNFDLYRKCLDNFLTKVTEKK